PRGVMVQQKDDNKTAQIASNDGWNAIAFKLRRRLEAEKCKLLLCEISMMGEFWDREKYLPSDGSYELSSDFHVVLPQVILSENGVRGLAESLEAWLCAPFEFEVDLSGSRDQEVRTLIGPRDDFISKTDRPVFSLRYSSTRMKAEWCFVTDQSCINILL